MLRNEGGFTFLEGIVSFSLILLVSSALFPLMSNMISHLKEGKKEMTAYRLMYEHIEKQMSLGTTGTSRVMLHDIVFDLFMEEGQEGEWKVCASYEGKVLCAD